MIGGKNTGQRTADGILIASAVAAAGAACLPASFISGLLFHTAMAAAVGGAADWFAVNSLFRKPLGIPFRTELVPRSRDKIIHMARTMMTEEILTVPRIYSVLKSHSLSAAVLPWLKDNRTEVRALLGSAVRTAAGAADKQRLGQKAADAAAEAVDRINWAELLYQALSALERSEHRDRIFRGLRNAVRTFLQDGFTDAEILDMYHRAWNSYEKNGMGRNMLRGLLQSQLGLNDEKAAGLIRKKLMEWAESVGNPESWAGQMIVEAGHRFLERLGNDPAYQEKINALVKRLLIPLAHTRAMEWAMSRLEDYGESAADTIAEQGLRLLEARLENEELRHRMDRWVLYQIVCYLPRIQRMIGESVEKALSGYSGRAMADLIEIHVWQDLQMIRINGSLIGAVLGALSYIGFYGLSGGALL